MRYINLRFTLLY